MENSDNTHVGCQHIAGARTRRDFFKLVSDGIYGTALTYLLCQDLYGGTGKLTPEATGESNLGRRSVYDLKPRSPQFEPKAKAVIQFLMNGAPSQMDLFDPKPMLEKHRGELPEQFKKPDGASAVAEVRGLLPSPFKFAQHGKSGLWLSDAMPYLAEQVDDIAVIRSMNTPSPVHFLGLYVLQSGEIRSGQPTLGAWTVYGLGSMNQNLPAFIVLDDPAGLPVNGVENWQNGYLPPIYQGTRLRSNGAPVLDLQPEVADPPEMVKLGRGLLNQLDLLHKRERPAQNQLDARIATYELAARMQVGASTALDISEESKETLDMYGVGQKPRIQGVTYKNPGPDNFARRCIMARRLVERGVRFVQICLDAPIWDQHVALEQDLRAACDRTDKPVAALLKDLKQRGLLDSTLVVWAGEFGRLPLGQMHNPGSTDNPTNAVGRDHNGHGFSVWLAGGGIKGGTAYGVTDDVGYKTVENPVSVADFHATILNQLGLDYRQLFYEVDGKQERITSSIMARDDSGDSHPRSMPW